MQLHSTALAKELGISQAQANATITLLDEGATVPFISRYRKEATGGLDETAITAIREGLTRLRALDKRREAIVASLEERDLMTPELATAINAAANMVALEDIYLPYRPKRRTRAQMAREKGLEPLAERIMQQSGNDISAEAQTFVSDGGADKDKAVENIEAALAGARDIIAERISEDAPTRQTLRLFFRDKSILQAKVCKGKEEEGAKFRDWFEWSEPAVKAAGHRILAILRGEREGVLSVKLRPDDEQGVSILKKRFLKRNVPLHITGTPQTDSGNVVLAIEDAWKRLLVPSLETEATNTYREQAEKQAIGVFASNLRDLLLASPLGQQRVMAMDPGFRTGVKTVCLSAQGSLLHNETIYPHTGSGKAQEAARIVRELAEKFDIQAIAIGNGTAGRETETFVKGLGLSSDITTVMVDEAGASVYSASDTARKEFPDYDITVRGAVSIGRRLMDPLAELVKIDPKAIGVGQYQHDVNQTELKQALDDTVMSCVNHVGVELNTASAELLSYVSGLGPSLAANIIAYRTQNGPFASRKALLKVPRLGPKVFEQAAGFLRIGTALKEGNPLDATAVHPESYVVVEKMAKDAGCTVAQLINDACLRQKISLEKYVSDSIGLPTLKDIMAELAKPGRDPRPAFQLFRYADVHTLDDLYEGMVLPGIVTNVTAFGAFVDLGVHQDGLVHISQLADKFIKDPAEVVKVRQQVQVWVLEVDHKRKRISLSMKGMGQ
ncbi:Tex family protein [Oleidesulfovibrio sp.]|uniref:Tex family protein n=1 Tax=Oleidesulfovibrio sp. TaxID=2909707 RepID=UPI003A86D946